ncbi:MAG TPA: hypothetical protein VJK48_01815 [Chlamydiales bacterium]|nr:hypothetical protein [Chlamydiales bacterium]
MFCSSVLFVSTGFAQTWNAGDSGGDWNNASNWNPDTSYPNSTTAVAIFNSTDNAAVNGSFSLLQLQLNTTSGDTIILQNGDPIGTLSFASSVNPSITVSGEGSANISCGVSVSSVIEMSDNSPLTISGAITGTGGITLSDGTLELSGTGNTYSGATTIDLYARLEAGIANGFSSASNYTVDGTLALNGYSNTINSLAGTGIVTLLTSETLTISNGGTTFSGLITGGNGIGGLTLGSGTLILSVSEGFNNYSGTTSINNGATLQAGSANAFSPNSPCGVTGTLDLNGFSNTIYALAGGGSVTTGGGTLTVNNGGSFSGTITGTGGLTLSDGTLILLASSNTYSGSLDVTGGTCQISSGVTLGSSSNTSADSVSEGATLTVDGTLYCGPLQNDGTVSIGSGGEIFCTTLTSTDALTGCGTINVDGIVTNLSTVNPGCSVSPLTINGNFESLSGSTLSPSLDGSSIATLIVSGDATLGNDVALILRPEPDCYEKSHDYAVLTAGGAFSGTFSTIEMGTYFLNPSLSYGPHGVELTVTRKPIRELATGDNAAAVAAALDSLADSGYSAPCSAVTKLFFSSRSEIATALESMDPALFKGQTLSQENNVVKVRETLSYRMQDVLNREHC